MANFGTILYLDIELQIILPLINFKIKDYVLINIYVKRLGKVRFNKEYLDFCLSGLEPCRD